MKKIKVVHIIYSFGIGGLEKGIATLVNHGAPDIAHIIVSLTGTNESERLLSRKTKIVLLNKKDGNSPGFIWKLSTLLRQIKPDIVHTRNWSGMDGIFAAKLAGIDKIIHGEHGWDMLDPFGANVKRKLIRKVSSAFVHEYTCVSKQLKDWLQHDINVGKKITQIYNGIDTQTYRPAQFDEKIALKQKLGFSAENFVVGIVGRLDAIKNHSRLFKAFRRVVQKDPCARLVVVGDGAEMHWLKSEAFENVVFLGYRSDTARLMRCFDLFVLPSLNEGISNTILEAMASGLPIVASNVGGNPELVANGETGFLVDPYDMSRLAEMIAQYRAAPSLAERHGNAGREKALSRFSIESMVNAYEATYRNILF
ncbi:MAG: glycosyltransferase [Desulfobacterales bacterium]|jgi:sugar transferase (PEP-CTERM/EpsH1 system associated)|nr:glycosyltransferase [Desulfobacterales bacterium]